MLRRHKKGLAVNTTLSKITKALFSGEVKELPQTARMLPSGVLQDSLQRSVLLLDCSGSMAEQDYPPSRLKAAKESAVEFVKERAARSPGDEIAVVSYEEVARCECPLRSAEYFNEISKAINKISLGGCTAMGLGLQEAEKILTRANSGGILSLVWNRCMNEGSSTSQQKSEFLNRVILLTDGVHCHSIHPLPIAKRLKEIGVQIDCIGIGSDRSAVNEDLLQEIASIDKHTGKPRYRFINDRGALQKHFQELATGISR